MELNDVIKKEMALKTVLKCWQRELSKERLHFFGLNFKEI